HPAGFVEEPRPGPVADGVDRASRPVASEGPDSGSDVASAADPALAGDPNAMEMTEGVTGRTEVGDHAAAVVDGGVSPRSRGSALAGWDGTPPGVEDPPSPPAHASQGSWHPSDTLVCVDPAS